MLGEQKMSSKNCHMSLNLKQLDEIQIAYDKVFFDLKGSSVLEKIRHINLHLTCTLGKLARFCEKAEHAIKNGEDPMSLPENLIVKKEVIADLLSHAAQLGNLLETDLESAFLERIAHNTERFAKTKL